MITHEELLRLLEYRPETGQFIRRVWIKGRKAGSVAGSVHETKPGQKYRSIVVAKTRCMASHLAFFYMTGQWPEDEIDHKNGDSTDDRWENLRPATRAQNEVNKGAYKNNKTGLKGVRFYPRDSRYRVAIMRGRRRVSLGSYETAEEAAAVYARAAAAADGEFFRPPTA